MEFKIPLSLKAEHRELHSELAEAIESGGDTGEAAKRENKHESIRFSEKLAMHAQTEEEVLYPASILVGEYLKLRLL